jgi:hypothetical protein
MDPVITRIIEIEKQSAMDLENAEGAYRKNIEAHRRALEEEKNKAHAHILSTENTRLKQALSELNKQTEEASMASGRDYESRFNDPALIKAIKKRVVAILLMQ